MAAAPGPAEDDDPSQPVQPEVLRALAAFGNPAVGQVCVPSGPRAGRTVRRLAGWVVAHHWALGEDLADTVCLLVSELVGNAVRHTGARTIGLRMVCCPAWIGAEVRDPSRAMPCIVPTRSFHTTGRGLLLVDTLADRWGVNIEPRGKIVWFQCALPQEVIQRKGI
ncbi:ATP-binding protein [Streptomyces netropsis]|uniref:ATP-binding protein n=1 Tax=Streptomyces netropsis TaxID=55404 RepID=UPI0030D00D70